MRHNFLIFLFLFLLVGGCEAGERSSDEDGLSFIIKSDDDEFDSSNGGHGTESPLSDDFYMVRRDSPANDRWNLIDFNGDNTGVDSLEGSPQRTPPPASSPPRSRPSSVIHKEEEDHEENHYGVLEPVEDDDIQRTDEHNGERENLQTEVVPNDDQSETFSAGTSLNTPNSRASTIQGESLDTDNIQSSGISYQLVVNRGQDMPRIGLEELEENSEDQKVPFLEHEDRRSHREVPSDSEEHLLGSTEAINSATNLFTLNSDADGLAEVEEQDQDERIVEGEDATVNQLIQQLPRALELSNPNQENTEVDQVETRHEYSDEEPIIKPTIERKPSFTFDSLSFFSSNKQPSPPRFASTGSLFSKPSSPTRNPPRFPWSNQRSQQPQYANSPLDPNSPSEDDYQSSHGGGHSDGRGIVRSFSSGRFGGRFGFLDGEMELRIPRFDDDPNGESKKGKSTNKVNELKQRAINFFTTAPRYTQNPNTSNTAIPLNMDQFAPDHLPYGEEQNSVVVQHQPKQISYMTRGDQDTVISIDDHLIGGRPYDPASVLSQNDIDSILSTVDDMEKGLPPQPRTRDRQVPLFRSKSLFQFRDKQKVN